MSDYTDKIDELAGYPPGLTEAMKDLPAGCLVPTDRNGRLLELPATRRWLAERAARPGSPPAKYDRCCVCNEYPWPHGIGVGRCHGAYPVRDVFNGETQ